jgi:hypothetical protein
VVVVSGVFPSVPSVHLSGIPGAGVESRGSTPARRSPRARLVAIPSSQGLSEPPSAGMLSGPRQALRKVIATTSSAVGQSPVSRKAWLYTGNWLGLSLGFQ